MKISRTLIRRLIIICQGVFGFHHHWNKHCFFENPTERENVSCGYVLKQCAMTHHKYQFSHIGPGEVVQQLPHRTDILQKRSQKHVKAVIS